MSNHSIRVGNHYMIWSSVVDAPITSLMSFERYLEMWEYLYGDDDGINFRRFNRVYDRMKDHGTSFPEMTPEQVLKPFCDMNGMTFDQVVHEYTHVVEQEDIESLSKLLDEDLEGITDGTELSSTIHVTSYEDWKFEIRIVMKYGVWGDGIPSYIALTVYDNILNVIDGLDLEIVSKSFNPVSMHYPDDSSLVFNVRSQIETFLR